MPDGVINGMLADEAHLEVATMPPPRSRRSIRGMAPNAASKATFHAARSRAPHPPPVIERRRTADLLTLRIPHTPWVWPFIRDDPSPS